MDKIFITGGKKLSGTIEIGAMKNAALPILFGTVLTGDVCVIENLPHVDDITIALEMLSSMGAILEFSGDRTLKIDTRYVKPGRSPLELARKIRGSYYVLGAELGRFGKSSVGCPGGCDFGERPIDQHIKGFEALGAVVTTQDGIVTCESNGRLTGSSVYLDVPSVGATVNTMLAAVKAEGMTIIDNAAREPHIVDLANFLNSCGANIIGAGTEVIKIRGVEELSGCTYAIIPDMIEAGTYMIAAAATKSKLTISNIIPRHLESITAKLLEMGVSVEEGDDTITVTGTDNLKRIRVKTTFYPGFPSDMNPQICVLLCLADGVSTLTESVWDNRFKYTDELVRMGAKITVSGRDATIEGVPALHSATVRAVDLRAGAAMIIAALCTNGTTCIDDIHHIKRGYENIVEKLASVGADIRMVTFPEIV